MAKNSIGITVATDAALMGKTYILGEIEDLKNKLADVTEKIKHYLSGIEYAPYLLSIQGVEPGNYRRIFRRSGRHIKMQQRKRNNQASRFKLCRNILRNKER